MIAVTVLFLHSLLIAWLLFLLTGWYQGALPFFRLILGIAILFAVLVPAFILLEGFRYNSVTAGFFVPIVLYALMYPLFNSLVRHLNLFLDPAIIIPAITGGIGFGLIGLGAYHMRNGIFGTFVLVTTGITIIFLSSPVILGVFFFVFKGNPRLSRHCSSDSCIPFLEYRCLKIIAEHESQKGGFSRYLPAVTTLRI